MPNSGDVRCRWHDEANKEVVGHRRARCCFVRPSVRCRIANATRNECPLLLVKETWESDLAGFR